MTVLSKNRSMKIARSAGFSLLELMLAISMFVVVGGAAFLLFRQAVPVYTQQQNLAGVNIGVQNAVAQLQQDLVNAGTGYYAGSNIPSWPVGVSIINQSDTSSCVTGSPWVYSSACFDQLNIITSDPNTAPQHVQTLNTNTATTLIIPTTLTGLALTTLAGRYAVNDELLLVSGSGLSMTTIRLSQVGSVVNGTSNIQLTFYSTNTDGTNTVANDALGITTHATTLDNGSAVFGVSFGASDWLLRLQPITYQVDTTNAANPVLERVQSGTTNVLAQQIIGFRVGASMWNHTSDTDSTFTDGTPYNYQACSYGTNGCSGGTGTGYDFTLVRSVRVSIIGRTTPGATGIYNYQNSFDGGPYQVMGAAVVVNPRNLSMADN
jgi:Tfp pilus assembly protein PilW